MTNSYALTLMVIFFLQNEGILPTVKELQDNISPEENEKIDNWQVGFAKGMLNCPKEENPNRRSVTRLMYKFFEFYSEFEYKTMIISPYLGRPITKEMFVTPRKLRQTLPTYAITVEAGKNAPMVSDSPLVVQDPFELNNNVTKSLIKDALSIWKKMCTVAKEDFPREKFYRLFDLKDMPRELKSRKIKIREREKRFERERERKEKEQEEETAKLLESHTVPAMEPNNDLTMLMEEANDPMDEAINCDEADRMFVLNYVPGEIHQTYKDLLQTDPTRRYKDKFNSLAEIVIDHVLVHTLRFEHIGEDPPPTLQERKNEEPDAKKARKSRWGPDKQKYVDRKRLSEYDYQGFCPVWDFRKLTRKKFNYDDKTLEMEQVISEKICEKFGVWREMAPMAAFKVWTHHSKVYPGAVCVHAMDLESRRGIWYTAEKFLKVFLPYWTKQVIFFGTVEIDNL